jgi:pentatricopeptide repeat protein
MDKDAGRRRAPQAPARTGGGANRRLRGLVQRGELDCALHLAESISGVGKHQDVIPCNILIKKLCADGRVTDAERLVEALGPSAVRHHHNLQHYAERLMRPVG